MRSLGSSSIGSGAYSGSSPFFRYTQRVNLGALCSVTYQEMEVGPADPAFVRVEQSVSRSLSGHTVVEALLSGVLVQFRCDQVEIEVVANHALHEELVEVTGPLVFG